MIRTIETRNLTDHAYSQCKVYVTENTVTGGRNYIFESYKTVAASLDEEGFLSVTCLCSATTRKQVSWFLKEYAPMVSYQIAKILYNNNEAVNIYTGEIIFL